MKVIHLFLAVALLTTIGACGQNETAPANTQPVATPSGETSPTAPELPPPLPEPTRVDVELTPSEDWIGAASMDTSSPVGATIRDKSGDAFEVREYRFDGVTGYDRLIMDFEVAKSETGADPMFRIRFINPEADEQSNIFLNTASGEFSSSGGALNTNVVDSGTYWRVTMTAEPSREDLEARFIIFPAAPRDAENPAGETGAVTIGKVTASQVTDPAIP